MAATNRRMSVAEAGPSDAMAEAGIAALGMEGVVPEKMFKVRYWSYLTFAGRFAGRFLRNLLWSQVSLAKVSFQWKKPDFLLKNPDFL